MILQLPERVNHNAALCHRGRHMSLTFVIGVGDEDYFVKIDRGQVTTVETRNRPLQSWQFALRAAAEDWQRFWQPVPEPGWHDIFALAKEGRLRIEGNLQPFMANLRYIKDLLASLRDQDNRDANHSGDMA